jgi:hypothetical protein
VRQDTIGFPASRRCRTEGGARLGMRGVERIPAWLFLLGVVVFGALAIADWSWLR